LMALKTLKHPFCTNTPNTLAYSVASAFFCTCLKMSGFGDHG